jgi:hypothetical protein
LIDSRQFACFQPTADVHKRHRGIAQKVPAERVYSLEAGSAECRDEHIVLTLRAERLGKARYNSCSQIPPGQNGCCSHRRSDTLMISWKFPDVPERDERQCRGRPSVPERQGSRGGMVRRERAVVA